MESFGGGKQNRMSSSARRTREKSGNKKDVGHARRRSNKAAPTPSACRTLHDFYGKKGTKDAFVALPAASMDCPRRRKRLRSEAPGGSENRPTNNCGSSMKNHVRGRDDVIVIDSDSDTEKTMVKPAESVAPDATDNSDVHCSTGSDSYEDLLERSRKIQERVFGVSALRNLQPTAVSNALRGLSQIIVMATGAGKSLCYQLPALTLPGMTVVVCPLIALMTDQVQALQSKNICAKLLSSANTAQENAEVWKALSNSVNNNPQTNTLPDPPIKLLYCTPELVETDRFRNVITSLHRRSPLSLIAIDEAHCMSTWGHDFRPAYRKLGWFTETFSDSSHGVKPVPIMACTATATPKVINDIRDMLSLTNHNQVKCYVGSFNRPNITYEVRYKDNLDTMSTPKENAGGKSALGGAIADLIKFIKDEHKSCKAQGQPCSGIVYVHKRTDTTQLSLRISKDAGVRAAAYHAGLSDAVRKQTQMQWTNGSIQVAVATVAFGMGIDLANVRYVIHWTLSKTVEGFYQESGRAGRDGKPSRSILYYSKQDASLFSFIIKKSMEAKRLKEQKQHHQRKQTQMDQLSLEALQRVVEYCTSTSCRRVYLLKHFGETADASVCGKTCDYCKNPSAVENAVRASEVVRHVASMPSYVKSSSFKPSTAGRAWNGQWDKPHGDNDSDVEESHDDWWNDFEDDSLNLVSSSASRGEKGGSSAPFNSQKLGGFVKAKDVLKKYEMMECQAGKKDGFVKFRTKDREEDVTPQLPPTVPEHLKSTHMPDPLACMAKSKPKLSERNTYGVGKQEDGKSSDELRSEVDRLKAEVEQLKAKRAAIATARAARNAANLSSNDIKKAPPTQLAAPPPISFARSRSSKSRKRR